MHFLDKISSIFCTFVILFWTFNSWEPYPRGNCKRHVRVAQCASRDSQPVVLRTPSAPHGFDALRASAASRRWQVNEDIHFFVSSDPTKYSKKLQNVKRCPKIWKTSDGGVRFEGRQLPPSEAAAVQTVVDEKPQVTKTIFQIIIRLKEEKDRERWQNDVWQMRVLIKSDMPTVSRWRWWWWCGDWNHWQQIARDRKMRLFKRRSSDPIDPQLTGLRFGEVRIGGQGHWLWQNMDEKHPSFCTVEGFSKDKIGLQGKNGCTVHLMCTQVNESQFWTRDKSGVFVKSWLSNSVEWENETRKADPKQTWPEGLVSWPSLNLLCFVPNARPIIWDFTLVERQYIFVFGFTNRFILSLSLLIACKDSVGLHMVASSLCKLQQIGQWVNQVSSIGLYPSHMDFDAQLVFVVCLCLSLMKGCWL